MPSPLDPAPAADPTALPGAPSDTTAPKTSQSGGRKNPWLAHVKATMRGHRNKSFKQVLKIAKKTYRKKSRSRRQSQSQSSQNGGKKRKQKGGSGIGGGKEGMAAFGENAAPVA